MNNFHRLMVASVLSLGGCVMEPEAVDITSPAPPTARTVISQAAHLGDSVKGQPIELHRFGTLGPTTLVLAGIHGNEQTTVTLSKNLIIHLQKHPEIYRDRQIAIIPIANPDGFVAGTRNNAKGVDCNRNFPATNFRARSRYGGEATSQPETRAIMSAIETMQPKLIISIHSIDDGKECNNYDGPAAAIAQLMHVHNGYPVTKTMGYPTPGSLGSWAGIDRQIPIITLELPRKQPGEAAWAKNQQALLAAIAAAG